jgi:WhiB family redox-sensing transcriptional regulator
VVGWNRATWDGDSWRREAACRDVDPDVFFPVGATGPALERIAVAKAHCAGCVVAEACLVFAVTTNQEYGVWGGLDEEERRGVRRDWRRAGSARRRESRQRLAG